MKGERDELFVRLNKQLCTQQSILFKGVVENIAALKASYKVCRIISSAGKPFSDGEFIIRCMNTIVEELAPNSK